MKLSLQDGCDRLTSQPLHACMALKIPVRDTEILPLIDLFTIDVCIMFAGSENSVPLFCMS